MRILVVLALALIAAPASAETFRYERDIIVPSIIEPTDVAIELSPAIQAEGGFRIVTETGFAIPFYADEMSRDLMSRAQIVEAPAAADTVPQTRVEMIRSDGSFQPVTASWHTFRFSFPSDITPVQLRIVAESGRIESMQVRGGLSEQSLKNLFAGPAYGGTSVTLSGERVRIVEVTLQTSGVLKIQSIELLDVPHVLLFHAIPGKSYIFLSGASDAAYVSFRDYHRGYVHDPTKAARLGNARTPVTQDDHDGRPASADNCPSHWNWYQADEDSDGFGDACDPCPTVKNGEDSDKNGMCDALEDPDEDGIATIRDNCPTVLNYFQEDEDADGVGNLCDSTDNRFSADKPWLLWAGMAVMVVALMGVAALALRKKAS